MSNLKVLCAFLTMSGSFWLSAENSENHNKIEEMRNLTENISRAVALAQKEIRQPEMAARANLKQQKKCIKRKGEKNELSESEKEELKINEEIFNYSGEYGLEISAKGWRCLACYTTYCIQEEDISLDDLKRVAGYCKEFEDAWNEFQSFQ